MFYSSDYKMLSVKEQITNGIPFSDQSTLVLFWRKFGGSILHSFITGLYQKLAPKASCVFLETFIQYVSDRHVFSVRLEKKI